MRSTYPSRLAAVLMFVCWWCGPLCPHNLFAAEPPAKESAEPTVSTVAAPLPKVRMSTSHGDIDIELYEDDAPNTVANFIELSEKHFFDGLKFHDVINNRWVQSGDPTGTGRGGPSYKFAHEINAESLGLDKIMVKDFVARYKMTPPPGTEQLSLKDLYEKQGFHFVPNLKSHPVVKGALAMAYRTPDTNGSQFFIALNDCPWLDGKHTVFGHVTGGLEILKLVQKGDIVDKIEIVSKRDHPYHVKTLEEKSSTPQPQSQTQPQLEKPIVTEPHK